MILSLDKSGSPATAPGIFLVDDHEVIRRGLKGILETEGLRVAGESASAKKALRLIPATGPELVILDDELPDGSGIDVCRRITASNHNIRCLVMTGTATRTVVIESILAGAWGCMSKQDSCTEQLGLIRGVMAGRPGYSHRFRSLLQGQAGDDPYDGHESGIQLLTRRELDAALRLSRGKSNREIAEEMFLAEKTIKNMISSILVKLGTPRRTQAATLVAAVLNRLQQEALPPALFPKFSVELSSALARCLREPSSPPISEDERARDIATLAREIHRARLPYPDIQLLSAGSRAAVSGPRQHQRDMDGRRLWSA